MARSFMPGRDRRLHTCNRCFDLAPFFGAVGWAIGVAIYAAKTDYVSSGDPGCRFLRDGGVGARSFP